MTTRHTPALPARGGGGAAGLIPRSAGRRPAPGLPGGGGPARRRLLPARPDRRRRRDLPPPAPRPRPRGGGASQPPEAVAFARRPGTFALVIDCAEGARGGAARTRPRAGTSSATAPSRPTARTLFTTENDIASGQGRIGVWDAADGYRRIGEVRLRRHRPARDPADARRRAARGRERRHRDRPDLGPGRAEPRHHAREPRLSRRRHRRADRAPRAARGAAAELDPPHRRGPRRHPRRGAAVAGLGARGAAAAGGAPAGQRRRSSSSPPPPERAAAHPQLRRQRRGQPTTAAGRRSPRRAAT